MELNESDEHFSFFCLLAVGAINLIARLTARFWSNPAGDLISRPYTGRLCEQILADCQHVKLKSCQYRTSLVGARFVSPTMSPLYIWATQESPIRRSFILLHYFIELTVKYGALAKAGLFAPIELSMMRRMIRILTLCIIGVIVLAGCNLARSRLREGANEAGDSRLRLQASPLPATLGALIREVSERATTQPPTEARPSRCVDVVAARPARQVDADVRINYETKSAQVVQLIKFVNREPQPLGEMVLDVQANQWEEGFQLLELTVNDQPAAYELVFNRLYVSLDAPLKSGCWLALGLKFHLQPKEIRDGLRSYRGFFGYSPRQLNLGHFLPAVAARLDGGWRIHEPIGIGEQVVYEVADWRVRVSVENAADTLVLAAPGAVSALAPAAWDVKLLNSRDFAISLSEEWSAVELRTADDVIVEVYAFSDAQIFANGVRLDGADHVLQETEKALALYNQLFGRYERARFVIVQGDFPDGMEFTGLVFVGGAWFTHFDGGPRNYLTLISVHEIAHQWWYARVGNDSALNPWLDEALATYSEYLFIEAHYPADKNWWWSFRVAGFFPQGMVDSDVYEFATAREYINAVYLRGVQMLHNLRVDIGDDAFYQLLRAYVSAGAGKIADPTMFWRQLPPEQRHLTEATRMEYLRGHEDGALFGAAAIDDLTPDAAKQEE